MDIAAALAFLSDHRRGVLLTYRRDGSPQMSPIVCAPHPDGAIEISSRETAFKVTNLQRDPRAALCVFTDNFFGPWLQIDGAVHIVRLPDAMDGLVHYYRRAAGEHPDWDEYRAAMQRERRVLIRLRPDRAGPDRQG